MPPLLLSRGDVEACGFVPIGWMQHILSTCVSTPRQEHTHLQPFLKPVMYCCMGTEIRLGQSLPTSNPFAARKKSRRHTVDRARAVVRRQNTENVNPNAEKIRMLWPGRTDGVSSCSAQS